MDGEFRKAKNNSNTKTLNFYKSSKCNENKHTEKEVWFSFKGIYL